MKTISLDGEWELYHFTEETLPIQHPDDLARSGLIPMPALVPGNVELDLQRAGQLPEIFFGEHIRNLRSLETHEWWYIRRFPLPADFSGKRIQLVFAGLDTLATVWVNGSLAGSSANMLVEQRFEVSAFLRPGAENTIAVRLGSAINAARRFQYDAAAMSWEHRAEGLYLRKAPHVWGWDIMPRAVSTGIWRPVWLETVPDNTIEQLYW